MAGPQTVWGIDVGKCALKAVKLRVGPDKSVEVVAADYIEHAKIMTQADADADALWTAALEKFLSRNDISNDQIAVSVPGEHTLARFSKLPPLEKKEMKKKIPDLVRYEADQQIPFDMDEVVWDYQVFDAPDSPEIEVGIFAIKRDLIRGHLHHFESGNIEPSVVQSGPLAVYNAMHYDGALTGGAVVLVDIGTENTNLLVATEDTLWTRTIKFGGNAFTDALVKSFKLSFSKAETLKRTAGSSKYARQIFQAMRPVFADLVQELQRSIGFYTATHRDVELEKIIGLGAAFKLPGLKKYVQQNLQLDIDRLEHFHKIKIPATAEGGDDQAGSFAVAYGLALQGLGLSKATSSLLPPEIVRQVVWRKKRVFFAAAAACLLFAAGVIWFRGISDLGTLQNSSGNTNVTVSPENAEATIQNPPTNVPPREYGATILAAARAFQSKNSELSSQGEDERNKIKTVMELQSDRVLWPRIVDAIHRALPAVNDEARDAASAKAFVAAVKQVPRRDRNEVIIESLESKYLPNVDDEAVKISDPWHANVDPIADPTGAGRKGFLITMRCRTPNSGGGMFVSTGFAKNLLSTCRQPKAGFYIDRIGVANAAGDRPSGSGGGTTNPPGGGWGGGTRPKATPSPANLDPLTGESIDDDMFFQVTFDLVIGDLPEKPAENQNQGQG
ncbi:MAG TPA: type IV pilus assembly protein PilM [Phycisphaerae bacterium]|nr:type IV pilus assembly protein PilM [Phycisphaerales bacterium]HRX85231.1 type IV pilus assembly protein PilM [Phycisphaerae bacterium]